MNSNNIKIYTLPQMIEELLIKNNNLDTENKDLRDKIMMLERENEMLNEELNSLEQEYRNLDIKVVVFKKEAEKLKDDYILISKQLTPYIELLNAFKNK